MKTPHWPPVLGYKPIDLGLERVKELLNRLGNPENKLPPVVHVAGTNGKGSTMAYLRAILEAAGYKVHAYTSPHLVEFNERIVLAGEQIEDGYLNEILEECKSASKGVKITFFEGTTIAAILAFSRTPADIILLETGMGGRLDATNVFDKPALTIITPIAMDHMEFLGNSVDKIAFEKASIMKGSVNCVVSRQEELVIQVINGVAEKKGVKTFSYGREWNIEKDSPDGLKFIFGDKEMNIPKPSLEGEHQLINVGSAIASAMLLDGFTVSEKNIKDGITLAKWPGRLQKINHTLTPDGSEIWVDGGHNDQAAVAISNKAKEWDDKPLYLIIGMMERKDCKGFLSNFCGIIKACYAIDILEEDGSMRKEDIINISQNIGIKSYGSENLDEAIKHIVSKEKNDFRIIICGSLYLVGRVLADIDK